MTLLDFLPDPLADGRARMDAARAAANAAIAGGERNASPDWRRRAVEIIAAMDPGREFMAEDVTTRLASEGVTTHDPRAMGAVMRDAQRRGLAERIGWAPAASSHGSPKVLWRRVG